MISHNDFVSFHKRGLKELTNIFREPFIINGIAYLGILSGTEIVLAFVNGGMAETLGCRLTVSKDAISYRPSSGQIITVRGKPMRVESVTEDETSYEIVLITATQ